MRLEDNGLGRGVALAGRDSDVDDRRRGARERGVALRLAGWLNWRWGRRGWDDWRWDCRGWDNWHRGHHDDCGSWGGRGRAWDNGTHGGVQELGLCCHVGRLLALWAAGNGEWAGSHGVDDCREDGAGSVIGDWRGLRDGNWRGRWHWRRAVSAVACDGGGLDGALGARRYGWGTRSHGVHGSCNDGAGEGWVDRGERDRGVGVRSSG